MANTTTTVIAATSMDIVAAILQAELAEKSVLLNSVSDYSQWVVKGAKTVQIPRASSFTAQAKVVGTATTYQNLTYAADELALNIYKHIPVLIEDSAREQSAVDLDGENIERMASAMVVAIESSIAGVLVKAANDIQLSGTSNLVLTSGDIVDARKELNDNDVPQEDRFLALPPAQEAAMLKISSFIDASQYGSNEPIMNGEIGRVFGFRVLVSNQFASDSEFCAYHKSHAAFARQIAPKFEKQRAPLNVLGDELSLSLSYGVKQLDSGNRGVYADETVVA